METTCQLLNKYINITPAELSIRLELRKEECPKLYYTYTEAAKMMGISKRQLQRILSDQDIEINYISPRCPRLTLSTIEELIQRRTISSN